MKIRHTKTSIWVCLFAIESIDEKILIENEKEELEEQKAVEPEIACADWSEYFNGLNVTAVVYDAASRRYTIYNRDLAVTRRSPCSTFKIISSLIALENGILEPEDSTRNWSKEVFWNEDWNKDIDFREAFRTPCDCYPGGTYTFTVSAQVFWLQRIYESGARRYCCHCFLLRFDKGNHWDCQKC